MNATNLTRVTPSYILSLKFEEKGKWEFKDVHTEKLISPNSLFY